MNRGRPTLLFSSAYPLALLLMLLPVVNITLTVWPLRFGASSWRFGAFGLLMEAIVYPVLGVVLAAFAAHLLEQRRALRAISVLSLGAGLLFLLGLVFFALDALQMRSIVQPAAKLRFDVTSARAAVWAVLGGTTLLWLGLGGWKASRLEAAKPRAAGSRPDVLVARRAPVAADEPTPAQ